MEIERKFLIDKTNLPSDLNTYPHNELEQAYIITNPVLRIRKKDDDYILTYKGQGLMTREEAEFPLPKESYEKLLTKTDGNIIQKTRYKIPDTRTNVLNQSQKNELTIELDIFHGLFEGIYLAEVEFPDEETAVSYIPPAWFGKDVTNENTFHNSTLSNMDSHSIASLIADVQTHKLYS